MVSKLFYLTSLIFALLFLSRDGSGSWRDGREVAAVTETPWQSRADVAWNEIPFTWRASGERIELQLEGSPDIFIYYFERSGTDTLILKRSEWPVGMELMRVPEDE